MYNGARIGMRRSPLTPLRGIFSQRHLCNDSPSSGVGYQVAGGKALATQAGESIAGLFRLLALYGHVPMETKSLCMSNWLESLATTRIACRASLSNPPHR